MKKLIPLILFFILFTIFINQIDVQSFQLQQAGIANIVVNKSHVLTSLGVIEFDNIGDTILYQGQRYALKAPGLFWLGAPIYLLLTWLGLSYVNNFNLVSYIMTIFLGALPAALMIWLWWLYLDKKYQLKLKDKIFLIIGLGLGTMLLSYSGVLNHDMLALLFLSFGWISLVLWPPLIILSGLSLGFSMVIAYKAIIPAILILIFLQFKSRNWHLSLGFVLGVLPLLIYHWVLFGNPLTPVHALMGPGFDVFPQTFDLVAVLTKFDFYFLNSATSLWINNPILILGFLGLIYTFRKRDSWFIILMLVLYTGYLLIIDTVGDCQYPPRYLLIMVPWMWLGLVELYAKVKYAWWRGLVIIIVIVSVMVNVIAATQPLMNCQYDNNAWQSFFLKYLYIVK